MPTFRSKPSTIEAVQWTGGNQQEVHDFLDGAVKFSGDNRYGWNLRILAGKDGAQDWVPVPVRHWVVHPPGDLNDVWPVDPDYFAEKYEAVE